MNERKHRGLLLAAALAITSLTSYQLALLTTTHHCLFEGSVSSSTTAIVKDAMSIPVLTAQGMKFESTSIVSAGQKQEQQPLSIRIRDLLETNPETSCASVNLHLVTDRLLDPSQAFVGTTTTTNNNNNNNSYNATLIYRHIPKIIHITTKSRCLPQPFVDNLQLWKEALPDHSFLLHNDAAMERLLFQKEWAEFTHLPDILQHCSISAAAKADLWRALVLYEYGGIYTDQDNAPRKFDSSSISYQDQAYFVVEEAGYLSQYFMAAAPKHPLMYLLIQTTLSRLLNLNDVDHQYVPYVTGPGALKQAFLHFMHAQGPNNSKEDASLALRNDDDNNSNNNTATTTTASINRSGKVTAGIYLGLGNTTITVVGRRSDANEYVARNVIYKKRVMYQKLMNMTHFSRIHSTKQAKAAMTTDSCLERLWKNVGHVQQDHNTTALQKAMRGQQDVVSLLW